MAARHLSSAWRRCTALQLCSRSRLGEALGKELLSLRQFLSTAAAAADVQAGVDAATLLPRRGLQEQRAVPCDSLVMSSRWKPHPSRCPAGTRRLSDVLRAYSQLSKLRLSALVTSTAAAGYVVGSPDQIDWAGFAWVSAGTMGAAACANSLNQASQSFAKKLCVYMRQLDSSVDSGAGLKTCSGTRSPMMP